MGHVFGLPRERTLPMDGRTAPEHAYRLRDLERKDVLRTTARVWRRRPNRQELPRLIAIPALVCRAAPGLGNRHRRCWTGDRVGDEGTAIAARAEVAGVQRPSH